MEEKLNKTFSVVGHVTILWFFRSLGLNLPKDWNILASVTHVHKSAGGSFLLVAVISVFKCLIKIQLNSDVLKNWVKIACSSLRKINSTAFFWSLYDSFKHHGGRNMNISVLKDENVYANQASLIIIMTRFSLALK